MEAAVLPEFCVKFLPLFGKMYRCIFPCYSPIISATKTLARWRVPGLPFPRFSFVPNFIFSYFSTPIMPNLLIEVMWLWRRWVVTSAECCSGTLSKCTPCCDLPLTSHTLTIGYLAPSEHLPSKQRHTTALHYTAQHSEGLHRALSQGRPKRCPMYRRRLEIASIFCLLLLRRSVSWLQRWTKLTIIFHVHTRNADPAPFSSESLQVIILLFPWGA